MNFSDNYSIDTSSAIKNLEALEKAQDKAAKPNFKARFAEFGGSLADMSGEAEKLTLGLGDLSGGLSGGLEKILQFSVAVGSGGLAGAAAIAVISAVDLWKNWGQVSELFGGEAKTSVEKLKTPLEKLTEAQAKNKESLDALMASGKLDAEQLKERARLLKEGAEIEAKIAEDAKKREQEALAKKVAGQKGAAETSQEEMFQKRFGTLGGEKGEKADAQRQALAALTKSMGSSNLALETLQGASQGRLTDLRKLAEASQKFGGGDAASAGRALAKDLDTLKPGPLIGDLTPADMRMLERSFGISKMGSGDRPQEDIDRDLAAEARKRKAEREASLADPLTSVALPKIRPRTAKERAAAKRRELELKALEAIPSVVPDDLDAVTPRIGGLGPVEPADWAKGTSDAARSLNDATDAQTQRDQSALNALSELAGAGARQAAQSRASREAFDQLIGRIRPTNQSLLGTL